ncbi:MAG: acyltransferase [Muribaculaceae bacterium]
MPDAETNTAKGRVFRIDAVRAFAMLAIVWSHSMSAAYPAYTETALSMYIGSASLFFMASGALIFPVRPSARLFLRRRLGSYVLQWLLFTIVYVALMRLTGIPALDDYRFNNLLKFAPLLAPWLGGWFLYALTGLYLFAPVLSPWLTQASRRGMLCFIALWLVAGFLPVIGAVAEIEPANSLVDPFAGYVGYMVAGYYLGRWPLKKRTARQRSLYFLIWGVIAFGLGVAVYANASKWGYTRVMYHDLTFATMSANMLIFGLFTMIGTAPAWLCKPVSWISRHSLTIYLWHLLMIQYVLVPMNVAPALIFPLTLVIVLPLSALTDKAFAPLTRRLRGV